MFITKFNYIGNGRQGASLRGQFVEIYNNTADTRRYDWTKLLCNAGTPAPPANANTDYLFAKNLFRVPEIGKTYPIAPGNSIIIAASLINHKAQ